MSLFRGLFVTNRPKVECPRCLGKGRVDSEDIKRLKQELTWAPGTCAYCNGEGMVTSEVEKTVAANAAYLTLDLSHSERERFMHGHPDALKRARKFEENVENFVAQIRYLHSEGNMKSESIAHFFLIGTKLSDKYEQEKKEMIEYVERVLNFK